MHQISQEWTIGLFWLKEAKCQALILSKKNRPELFKAEVLLQKMAPPFWCTKETSCLTRKKSNFACIWVALKRAT